MTQQDHITLAALERIERELEEQDELLRGMRTAIAAMSSDEVLSLPSGYLAEIDDLLAHDVRQPPPPAGALRA
ncbi:MAG: hypothetical protein KC766_21810 [Myxococcales bacterium]|nr:hypothetical protein [Myxococcales bacterium]